MRYGWGEWLCNLKAVVVSGPHRRSDADRQDSFNFLVTRYSTPIVVSTLPRQHGQLEVGRVAAAGVDDVASAIGRGVLAGPRHHGAQEASAADDEAQLFAGVERESDREQVDLEVDDFTR